MVETLPALLRLPLKVMLVMLSFGVTSLFDKVLGQLVSVFIAGGLVQTE